MTRRILPVESALLSFRETGLRYIECTRSYDKKNIRACMKRVIIRRVWIDGEITAVSSLTETPDDYSHAILVYRIRWIQSRLKFSTTYFFVEALLFKVHLF